ncbi:acyl-CoA dehydrogenase family protein [Castellaniella sp.]|uniref:acyl-CoA dehydrogenase family protein n=1 Tax=Castellaniella sp. TaxID=1955812 RepID=UPI003562DD1C
MAWMSAEAGAADNLVPDLPAHNLFQSCTALVEGVQRTVGDAALPDLYAWGQRLGQPELFRLAAQVNRDGPVLHPYDRLGRRIDAIEFPAGWHRFLALAFAQGMHGSAWTEPGPGAHAIRAAHYLLHGQVEAGSLCPITMTSAAIPLLAREDWFPALRPLLAGRAYDAADAPLDRKQGMMVGMGLTEKQGGTDLRRNTTQAQAAEDGGFRLTGEKWFVSSPTSDAHLVLALEGERHSCFYVPRWTPDGQRNALRILRLKDKLGNRSNASAEVRLEGAWGRRVGEPGRGIVTLIEMAAYTRMDCVLGSTALLRQALVQAIHHTRHRQVFGRSLADQPLMQQLLADVALESEAAILLCLHLAQAFDAHDDAAQFLRRLLTPAAKFRICKRVIGAAAECMEVWGGNGYIEDGPMARLYREAPVNSIWEGSGNVMCLDVLRAAQRHPQAMQGFLDDLGQAHDAPALRQGVAQLRGLLAMAPDALERQARRVADTLILLVQADLVLRHAPGWVAEAFVASRLVAGGSALYGAGSVQLPAARLLQRAWPG